MDAQKFTPGTAGAAAEGIASANGKRESVKRARWSRVLFSGLALFVGMLQGAVASATDSVLIAFSSDRCGACDAMRPALQRLEQSGVPVRRVDVNAEPDFARRHGIRQTPTFVVWASGRELTRLVGAQPIERLQSALRAKIGGEQNPTGAKVPSELPFGRPQTQLTELHSPRVEAMPNASRAQAVERAEAATVRLKVHDGRGYGVGTGTIIDTHGEEALVLTCGHLFRETKHESRVDVELFVMGQIRTVPGKVVDYDSEDRDIALVVIRPGFEVTTVQVLPSSEVPASGQSVFSFGCDHGADPSRRDTRITGIDKYNQETRASNIEIDGAPVDGRSGGGLFDAQGRLIGVCNAADYQEDVGIYTGPRSIQWQLDRVQLSRLYQPYSRPAPAPNLIADSRIGSARTAAVRNSAAPSMIPSSQEVIVIVRDRDDPDSDRVLTVRQPTSELMEMIRRQAR
ncbi:MAG: trypsin-like peptidase domain-containing protein [Planctomycetota bacterium]